MLRKQRRLQERELDPVRMEYRDPKREMSLTKVNNEVYESIKQRANDDRKNVYNIINQTGPPRKMDLQPRPERAKPPRDWHFLSHLKLDDHNQASVYYDEKFHLDRARMQPKSLKVPHRKFDIISNVFSENHDEKIKEEYNQTKDYVLKKYWDTHNYDLLRGKFYDPAKEDQLQQQRQLLSQVHGEAQAMRLPPR